MNLFKCCALGFAAIMFCISCGQQTAGNKAAANTNNATAETPAPPTPAKDDVATAADLYTVNCMTCHRDSGKGGPVTVDGKKLEPEDLTSAKMKKRSDEKLFGNISDGAEDEGMPAFKAKLSKEQITMLVAHLRQLQGK